MTERELATEALRIAKQNEMRLNNLERGHKVTKYLVHPIAEATFEAAKTFGTVTMRPDSSGVGDVLIPGNVDYSGVEIHGIRAGNEVKYWMSGIIKPLREDFMHYYLYESLGGPPVEKPLDYDELTMEGGGIESVVSTTHFMCSEFPQSHSSNQPVIKLADAHQLPSLAYYQGPAIILPVYMHRSAVYPGWVNMDGTGEPVLASDGENVPSNPTNLGLYLEISQRGIYLRGQVILPEGTWYDETWNWEVMSSLVSLTLDPEFDEGEYGWMS